MSVTFPYCAHSVVSGMPQVERIKSPKRSPWIVIRSLKYIAEGADEGFRSSKTYQSLFYKKERGAARRSLG